MPPTEVLVLCGGAKAAGQFRGRVLELDIDAPRGSASRVNLNLNHLSKRMAAAVPDRLADLVDIACYVYCADQFTRRDTPQMNRLGIAWRRRFRFRIPVRDINAWEREEVVGVLSNTLSFLSEDAYRFEFVPGRRSRGLEPYLALDDEDAPTGFNPDEVVLFSGGLDSLAGAADLLRKRHQRIALVSHHASPMIRSKQAGLVDDLRGRTEQRQLLHISVRVTKGLGEAGDFTQRSRSFLFATLGFVVANLFKKNRLTFFENGVLSLNLPIARH